MRRKIFYERKEWDGTTVYEVAACDECGASERVAIFTAELNAGEHFTVNVCRGCLRGHADRLSALALKE